jgi:transposase
MLTLEEWMDIKALRQEGHSVKAIAKMTGHSRNTVRSVLREKRQAPFQQPDRASCLDPYKGYIKERFLSHGLTAVRLFEEIRPMGYTGSVILVRRYVATLRCETTRKERLTVRFETPPGHQAQADWAHCGRFKDPNGKVIAVYAFVMVLSFSRMMFVEFTTSMKLDDLIRSGRSCMTT